MVPIAIDLFAGVGGLSLGAARAGFRVAAAVEIDARASALHARNFPRATHLQSDIQELSGEQLLSAAKIGAGKLGGLIGGPPCQGFSHIGLRNPSDSRNNLLIDFFRLVGETSPAFFLAENVPGVLDERNEPVLLRAREQVPKQYVWLEPFAVKASDYGAPTSRKRVFFYGYDPNRVAALTVDDFRPQDAEDVKVRDALANLPALRATWQSEGQSWRVVGELEDSAYAQRVMDRIPQGVGDSISVERYRKKREVSGFFGTIHEKSTIARFRELGPGDSDAVSKCTRLDPDGYCPTLRAGTGPERGSYQAIRPIHPSSPRVISPREAARLQGFPDWYQFHPTKWHSFRQIGNSVSPIAAEMLLGTIKRAMT